MNFDVCFILLTGGLAGLGYFLYRMRELKVLKHTVKRIENNKKFDSLEEDIKRGQKEILDAKLDYTKFRERFIKLHVDNTKDSSSK